jgi:hypothetical protein
MISTALFPEKESGTRLLALLAVGTFFLLSAHRLPAMPLFVSSTADNGPGTLRNLVANAAPGDTIFIPTTLAGQTIVLTGGELQLNKNGLAIIGPGATNFTVESFTSRAFHVTTDKNGGPVNAAVAGLTITGILHGNPGTDGNFGAPNGTDAPGSGGPPAAIMGGGILLDAGGCVLTVSNCFFWGCQVIAGNGGNAYTNDNYGFQAKGGIGGNACGGAICNNGGDLLLYDDAFQLNFAVGGNGGYGAYGGNGGNGGTGEGGALCDVYGNDDVFIVNCTFYTNSAFGGNGGKAGDAWTFHVGPGNGGNGGNGGNADGGAIYLEQACPDSDCTGIIHCTIDDNQLLPGQGRQGGAAVKGGIAGTAGSNGAGLGGGISHHDPLGNPGHVPMNNTIVAADFVTWRFTLGTFTFNGPDYYGEVDSTGYNFIGLLDPFSSGWDTAAVGADILGTAIALDPQLGPFQFDSHGLSSSITPTMAPGPCSPVVDAGTAAGFAFDQIQQPRPKFINGTPLYDGSDIGAYELQAVPTNAPALGILESTTGNQITISWPVVDDCFTLQQTPSLLPANWVTVTNPMTVFGNQCQVTISPLPLAGNMFYRLYHP